MITRVFLLPSLFGATILQTTLATALFACVAFAFFAVALLIAQRFGRGVNGKCACARSRQVLKILEERERAAKLARGYRAENVDVERLPIISDELARFARRDESGDAVK